MGVIDAIRVVVADDQPDVRDGFRRILDSDPSITVVGEAGDGEAALATVQRLRPDVLLSDVRMPRLDGLEVCRQVGELRGRGALATRVIVVTTFDLDDYVTRALREGAAGFLLKRSRPELLVEGVHAAMTGDTLISPELTIRLLSNAGVNPRHAHHDEASRLTPRELDVVRAVALGRTNAQIGAELFITAGTVKTHLANIQTKLGVANRVGIAAWAWSRGIVAPA